MLNELFATFDKLAEKHGLEKIKTIGDAYMVVAGIPQPIAESRDRDRAHGARHAGRDRRLREAHGSDLTIRIGIHTGPVVAGVIGDEEVHLRSVGRHREHGEPHGVARRAGPHPRHRGDASRCCADTFELEPREPIEIKGKGPMQTYLLVKQRQDPERVSIGAISGSAV